MVPRAVRRTARILIHTEESIDETHPARRLQGHPLRLFGAGQGRHHPLNRPERKNPLTFDSYGELRDLFREMVYATDIKADRVHRRGRQLLLRRRRARDHRPAGQDGHARAAGVHAHDRRHGQGHARLPAADHRGDRRRVHRRRRDDRLRLRHALCHRAQQARVPVRARRPGRRRHGRVHAAAAADRPVARRRPALHRPRRRRRGGRTLRLLQPPGRARQAARRSDRAGARAWPTARPSATR